MKAKQGLTAEEIAKLRKLDIDKQPGFVSAEAVLSQQVGKKGSAERDDFDAKAKAWFYGELLRERRKELGLTQKELAGRVGRERTYINRIEKGETDLQLSSFLRITEALDVKLRLEVSSSI